MNDEEGSDLERGATAAEYVLLVTLIAVFIIGGMTLFADAVIDLFEAPCERTTALDGYCH